MADYGLEPIYSGHGLNKAATPGCFGMTRWLAPEIIVPKREGTGTESKAADVFAFGMVAVEVFTGNVPFGEMRNEQCIHRISRGGRPERPDRHQVVGLQDEMWTAIKSCWERNPKKRPTIEEVVEKWERFAEGDGSPSSGKHTYSKRVPVLGTHLRAWLQHIHGTSLHY